MIEITPEDLLMGLDLYCESGHLMYESTENTASIVDTETGEVLFIDYLH